MSSSLLSKYWKFEIQLAIPNFDQMVQNLTDILIKCENGNVNHLFWSYCHPELLLITFLCLKVDWMKKVLGLANFFMKNKSHVV